MRYITLINFDITNTRLLSKRHRKAKKGRKTPCEEAARWPRCFGSEELGVQSWTEKMADDFKRNAKSK